MVNMRLQTRLFKNLVGFVATLAVVCLPFFASPVQAEGCTPPSYATGVHQPVGSDAAAYTYDCASGLWVSAHYTYDPSTGLTTPSDPTVYTYNSATGAYDYTVWVWDAPTGRYVAVAHSTPTPPAGATVIGAPTPTASISDTGPNSTNTISGSTGSISGTGPDSSNSISGSGNTATVINNQTGAIVNNNLVASATTGNALVLSNTTAGGATSGNAQDIANVMNLLQSASNALGGNTPTFVANIDGDVTGDLVIDPAMLAQVQPAALNTAGTNNTVVNNSLDAAINNDITVGATSGDATVANNTRSGDATSGSSQAVANIVNIINSAISSGQSFLGVININGNLNGDILLPPNFVDQLLAANVPTVNIITDTGPGSDNSISGGGSSNTTATNTNNLGITNNVNATATTGSADVSNNTAAGNATTGTARTNITAFNLTGSNVVGANDLLVFVNVLGQWVGLIVNAPPGATAAELGGGIISNNGPDSSNSITGNTDNNTDINNLAKQSITNNINLASRSGNASVNHNTQGGNARSGDASAAVNLFNVENSSLSLSNWFGILFINVFGKWNGSFGVNTAAGDRPTGGSGGSQTGAMQVFAFVPAAGGSQAGNSTPSHFGLVPYTTGSGGTDPAGSNLTASAALAVNTKPTDTAAAQHPSPASAPLGSDFKWWLIPASGSLFFIWLAGENLVAGARRRGLAPARLAASLRHLLF